MQPKYNILRSLQSDKTLGHKQNISNDVFFIRDNDITDLFDHHTLFGDISKKAYIFNIF